MRSSSNMETGVWGLSVTFLHQFIQLSASFHIQIRSNRFNQAGKFVIEIKGKKKSTGKQQWQLWCQWFGEEAATYPEPWGRARCSPERRSARCQRTPWCDTARALPAHWDAIYGRRKASPKLSESELLTGKEQLLISYLFWMIITSRSCCSYLDIVFVVGYWPRVIVHRCWKVLQCSFICLLFVHNFCVEHIFYALSRILQIKLQ